MASSPHSIEMQIDNFLEQFKRSASKAMEGDWPTTSSGGINANLSMMIRSRSRISCFEASELSGQLKILIYSYIQNGICFLLYSYSVYNVHVQIQI